MRDRLRSVRLPSRKRYKARRRAQIDHGKSGLLAEPGDLDGFTAITAQAAGGATRGGALGSATVRRA